MEHTQVSAYRPVRRSYWWALPIALALLGTLLVWSDVLFIDLLLPFRGFGQAAIWLVATVCKWGCLGGLVVFVAPQMGRQIYRNRRRALQAGIVWVVAMAALVGGFSFVREPISQLLGNGQNHFSPISRDSPEWEEWRAYFDIESDKPSSARTLVARWQSGQIAATEIILLSLIGVGLVGLAYAIGRVAMIMSIGLILCVMFGLWIGSDLLGLFIWHDRSDMLQLFMRHDRIFFIGSIVGPLTADLNDWNIAESVYSRIGFPIYAVLALSAWALDMFWTQAAARASTLAARQPIASTQSAETSALRDGRSSCLAHIANHFVQLLGALVVLVLMGTIWLSFWTQARSLAGEQVKVGQSAEMAMVSKGSANQLAYSPDGRALVVGASRSVYLYDARTLAVLWKIDSGARSVAVAPDGSTLALATYDDRIELRQMSDGRLLRKINQRTFHITKLAFAPNGATLAGLREERAVQLWQVSNGRLLRTFKRDRDITWYSATTDIAFSPDGTLLASATGFEIRLWNAATGKEYATIRGANSITSLAFAPNGRTIVAGVAHGGMREWSVRDGHRVVTLDFDVGASVDSVAFVPNSDTLALGLRDMSVRLWRTENPKMQQSTRVLRTDDPTTPLSKPSRPIPVWSDQDDPGIISLAFAPDGSTLAGAWDGGVRVWRLDGTSLGWLNGYQR